MDDLEEARFDQSQMDEWMRTDSTIQMSKEPFDNPNGKKLRSMLTKTDFLKQAKSTKKSGRKNDLGDLTVKLMGLPKISSLMSNAWGGPVPVNF